MKSSAVSSIHAMNTAEINIRVRLPVGWIFRDASDLGSWRRCGAGGANLVDPILGSGSEESRIPFTYTAISGRWIHQHELRDERRPGRCRSYGPAIFLLQPDGRDSIQPRCARDGSGPVPIIGSVGLGGRPAQFALNWLAQSCGDKGSTSWVVVFTVRLRIQTTDRNVRRWLPFGWLAS